MHGRYIFSVYTEVLVKNQDLCRLACKAATLSTFLLIEMVSANGLWRRIQAFRVLDPPGIESFPPLGNKESTIRLLEKLIAMLVMQQSSMLRLRGFRLLSDLPAVSPTDWRFSQQFLQETWFMQSQSHCVSLVCLRSLELFSMTLTFGSTGF